MPNEPANETAWIQFRDIISIINRLNIAIQQITRDINKLKSIKENILDNAELKVELKKVVDTYHDATMESIVADYTRFQALRNWMDENEF